MGVGVLSFLVFIHELGHYLAARWAGVHVEVFSIGFGPRLFGLKIGPTEYRFCLVPFGGYVAMRGEPTSALEQKGDPAPANELDKRWAAEAAPQISYEEATLGQRAVIAAAGPLVNIGFALVALWVLGMVGVNLEAKGSMMVSSVDSTGPAARAGLRSGDTVIALDGKPLKGANRFLEAIALSKGKEIRLSVVRGGRETTYAMVPEKAPIRATDIGWIGLEFGGRLLVSRVLENSPAAGAGFRIGDTLLSIDGVQPSNAEDLVRTVQASAGRPMRIALARRDVRSVVEVSARKDPGDGKWRIGISPYDVAPGYFHRFGPGEAVGYAFSQFVDRSQTIFRVLGKLISLQLAVQNLSGPVGIIRASAAISRLGWAYVVDWMVLLSINLGILNFLPLVVTDGGRLVEIAYEGLRGHKPNRRMMERVSLVVVGLFITLALYITWFDIQR